jgi:tetratricopeptide (TPR) repeat protein
VLFAQMQREAPRSFRTYWALGAEAFTQGDSVAGERAWREAIRLNPDHPQPLEDLGRLYARTGRWEPAIPLLERVVQLDSTRIGAALALTTGLTRTGAYAKALDLLDALERRDDGDAMLMLLRGDVLRRAGDYDRALAAAQEAVARDSTAWRTWVFAAETAVMAGDCATAAELAAGARRQAGNADREAVEAALAGVANREGSCK